MFLWHKLLKFSRKILHNMSEETNIIGKYNNTFLLTKDGNLTTIIELKGVSYSSYDLSEQEKFLETRNVFFKSIPSTISIMVFQKRIPVDYENKQELSNTYTNNVLKKWEEKRKGYETRYYICFTTKGSSLSTKLEKKRASIVGSKHITTNLEYLKNQLEETVLATTNTLSNYGVYNLSASEALSFFASYANMEETNVKINNGLLQDHYISANTFFEKDYIKHQTIRETYTRFISIKAYDTEEIDNTLIKKLLSLRKSLMICEQINNISKDRALRKIDDKIRLSNEIVQEELSSLKQLVSSDRETIIYYSLSIMFNAENLEELEETAIEIKQLFNQYGIVTVLENINLKPLYFSFFPGRNTLNSRKRIITSMNVSTLNFFEKDIIGFKKNSWGNYPLSVFATPSGALHFFNFHNSSKENALGHTIVIADSESGKTTLLSFLMACMEKYNILRLAFDKLNGMYCMCNYLNGEYADVKNMQLNPFSLAYDAENISFLESFLFQMGEIKDDEHQEIEAVRSTIKRIYEVEDTITLSDFIDSLPKIEGLKTRYLRYQDGIFDNEQCLLSFENSLSILGMDAILTNKKLSGLTAFYIFHKLKRVAEEKKKGFFVFIDELKDYINNPEMAKNILERILEARKSNGVMAVAVQNLDFFDVVENRDSFLDGFANYIIFPTRSSESLSKLQEQLSLNEAELDFLRSTDPSKHHVLFKNRKTKESIILNVSLKKLDKYLSIFNSSIQSVQKMKELQKTMPTTWREEYLKC